MKTSNILWFIIAITCLMHQRAYSQHIGDLKGIYYQAVAIDENGKEIVGMDVEGKPLYEKAIGVRFSITKGLDGVIQWEEIHTTTTDKYGLFSLIIGSGQQTGNGSYTKLLDVPWIDADQFLKVEISTKNDGNYKMVSNQQFMAVPYSFYSDDIADDAITSVKILDSVIVNQDIHTEAVDSRVILNETILAEDINTGAVTTSEILDSTIINQDMQTNAVDSRTILNNTILNEDIANNTIDLTTKVTGVLPVANGGTGISTITSGNLLVGSGTSPVVGKILASPDSSIVISQTADSIILKSNFTPSEVASDPAGTFVIGNLPAGSTYVSNAINSFTVDFGDVIIGSVDVNLDGCMLTAYVSQPNVIRVAIFNGTGGPVNLGTVNVRVFIVH